MPLDPAPMRVRGVRGATFVEADTAEAILDATRELLAAIAEANEIDTEDIASVLFTATPDLHAAFPARAARQLGWTDVPLLGATEMDAPEGWTRAVRVLLHWNTTRHQNEIVHVYLRGSDVMRAKDPPTHLAGGPPVHEVPGETHG